MISAALALTPGEPAGIGPDVAVMLAQSAHAVPMVAYADPAVLQQRAAMLGLPLNVHVLAETLALFDEALLPLPPGSLYVRPFLCAEPVTAGRLERRNVPAVINALTAAAHDCLRFPDRLALVTGPIQKSVINDAGIPFSGHTEFLQALAGVDKVVMMLATSALRVALVTTHLPLSAVPAAITSEAVSRTLDIVERDLRVYFVGRSPRLLVCGLNPHAGEAGHLGTEERDIIEPVLEACRARGWSVVGPVPADTAFTPTSLREIDVVVSMYHDQGLPVLKASGFGEAINVTLGLPFIRTSVDHGTALSLAGTGYADASSLRCAVGVATQMLQRVTTA